MHRITGGTNAHKTSQELLKNGFLSIGWRDFSSNNFLEEVKNSGIEAINNKYKELGWYISRNRWCLWRFVKQMCKDDIVLVPGYPNWGSMSIYKIVDDTVYTLDNLPEDIQPIEQDVDLGFFRKVTVIKENIPRVNADDKLYRRLKIQQTNSCITDLSTEVENLLNTNQIDSTPHTEPAFDISTAVYCIKSNGQNNKQSLFQDNLTYRIPIYQRPYSWGDAEVTRLLDDIFNGYCGGSDSLKPSECIEPMFIGNMQLTNRNKRDNGENVVDVVDGQQRISTIIVLLKYLKLKYPHCVNVNLCCLETVVADEQNNLETFLKLTSIPEQLQNNRYLSNLDCIQKYFDSKLTKKDQDSFDINRFVDYIFNHIYIVVVETEATISQIVKIFHTINTAGLDLNTGDLFKLQMSEYLCARDQQLTHDSAFVQVDELYKQINEKNIEYNKEYSILTILKQYQYYLIAKHKLTTILYKYSVERFYDNLFDALLNKRIWQDFTNIPETCVVELKDIKNMIDVVYECDKHYNEETDKEKVFNKRIIGWTRYSQYANIVYLMRFNGYDYNAIDKLLSNLSKIFIVYSLEYAKAINDIHKLMYEVRKIITNTDNKATYTKDIEKKAFSKEIIKGLVGAPIATMSTPINKNLICRISEFLRIKNDDNIDANKMVELLFNTKVDIEHIHATANTNECVGINDDLQNSIGNLMLLEYDINRSIQDSSFAEKKKSPKGKDYSTSKFLTANDVASLDQWGVKEIEERKDKQVESITDFLTIQNLAFDEGLKTL
jgi:uncharacterized protein with ParB-like and HNH nuclease domain